MERQDLILELCCEVGHAGFEDDIVEELEANPTCCNLYIDNAAQGDRATLDKMRICMGPVLMRY